MGRIGKRELVVPKGVEVKVNGGEIVVRGPKGSLTENLLPAIAVKVAEGIIRTEIVAEDKLSAALQGLYNALIKNMLTGVTDGWQKDLEMVGVGYRAVMQGKKLTLQVGFSHPVEFEPPAGIDFTVTANTKINIKGIDRQRVGQIAAEIRAIREVEPYKGKGIKYVGEVVRRKAGKAAKAAGGGGA